MKTNKKKFPLVSIILINWNGRKYLKECLESLEKVTYPFLEILFVDNNSTDDSVEFVRKKYNKIKIIQNKKNYGFAKGNNIGLRYANGEYVLFINNDTTVTPGFLEPLIRKIEKDDDLGCVQPQIRVLNKKHLIDEAGAYLTSSGFLYHFGYRKPISEKYNKLEYVYSIKGACFLVRKKLFEKVGMFDKDFYMYFEETDLCHRIWLFGYKVQYIPESVIYHFGGGVSRGVLQYENLLYFTIKNMTNCYLKNFGLLFMTTIFPVMIIFHIMLFVYFLLKGKFKYSFSFYQAYIWNIKNLSSTLSKRRYIQTHRVINDNLLSKYIVRNPHYSYYYYLLTGLERFKD